MSDDDTRIVPFVTIQPTTNKQFLELLFGDKWREAIVTSFTRDPADPKGPREDWNGWFAGDVLDNRGFDQGNTYFCPSLLVPGAKDRKLSNFRELNVLTVDDINTKLRLVEVVDLLRRNPTYLIETSLGNYQAGWKLEPGPETKDLAWVKGMLNQLDQALKGQADNLTNPIAWRRLPVGFNTKKALISSAQPKGWKVRLRRRGFPGPMIRGLDWMDEIEPRIGVITKMTTIDRGIGNGQRPDAVVLGQDPVYQALEAGGHILGEKITSDKHWAVTIKCPWIAGHGPTRPLTGAEYVPATPGNRGWFHCFHCETRGQAEFKEQLDEVLRSEGQKIVAAFEFDEVDPVALAFRGPAVGQDQGAIDLWSHRSAPEWPGVVFPAVIEDTLAELAERGGLDLGALGATLMTTASGAADKRSKLVPYAGGNWSVPPILWLMLIAEPGQRKTAILNHALDRLRKINGERMRRHALDMAAWRALSAQQRRQQTEPAAQMLLGEDTTVERLQLWMANNSKGLLYVRDELAGFLDFGRYGTGTGAATRAAFLEFYEGGPGAVGRMSRDDLYIENRALSLIGGIQPQRLAGFKGLTDDGLLSRFGTLIMPESGEPVDTTKSTDTSAITATIERLLRLGPWDYCTDAAGEKLIRDIEKMCRGLVKRPDSSVGYRGFLRKLHGTHARTVLVLHLIDGGQDQVVPEDTVARAERYALFLLDHADYFYAELDGSAEQIARAIGSYLLRHPTPRITAGQLRTNVASCKTLRTLKEIQDAVFLLVVGGWLKPETRYPDNKVWVVRPGLEDQFAARKASETSRVDLVKVSMNHQGRHRPTSSD